MPKVFKAVLVPSSLTSSKSSDVLVDAGGDLSAEFRHLLARLAQQHLKELAAVRHEVHMTNANEDVQAHLSNVWQELATLREHVVTPNGFSNPGVPLPHSLPGTAPSMPDGKVHPLMVTADSAPGEASLPGKPQPDQDDLDNEEQLAAPKKQRMSLMSAAEESRAEIAVSEPPAEDKHFYYKGRDFFSSMEVDLFIGALIMVNIFFMFAQCQYDGLDIGHKLQPNGTVYTDFPNWLSFPRPASEEWPFAKDILHYAETSFTIVFAIDVSLKVVFLGQGFWMSFLNILDATVVVLGLYGLADQRFQNPSYARILRLVKVTRLAGALKNSSVVASLQMLLKCISSSVLTLGWSLAVLITMQSVMGLTVANIVQALLTNDESTLPADVKQNLFYYYGTFSKTMMTMFQILFSNWIPCARVLIDNVSEWYAALFIVYRCFIGFAVMSVVRAVFVQSTMKVAQQDEELLISQKKRQNEVNKKNLLKLFKEIDTSGDGELSYDELEAVLTNPKMKLWMGALEIDTNDLQRLFHLLDDGDGNISIDEFVGGIGRLKGPAKAIDVASLMVTTNKIEAQLHELSAKQQTKQLAGWGR